jgi:hypothetical protein
MKHCRYCAQTITKLDGMGYCIMYSCFRRSGKQEVLDALVRKAWTIYSMPDSYGQIGRVVSNPYSKRHRFANDVMWEAEKEFGFVPSKVLSAIDSKYHGPWDKNIRW